MGRGGQSCGCSEAKRNIHRRGNHQILQTAPGIVQDAQVCGFFDGAAQNRIRKDFQKGPTRSVLAKVIKAQLFSNRLKTAVRLQDS